MNSKGIKPVDDKTLCMVCLKKKATRIYRLKGRGYGSRFDSMNTKFQCCEDCDNEYYYGWFNEDPSIDADCVEEYYCEDNISDLINNLPVESQELFENTFNTGDDGGRLEPQEWIDYYFGELPHEVCKYNFLYSPKDIEMYQNRFPSCQHVVNLVYCDGSSCSCCPFGARGEFGQEIDRLNPDDHCTDCQYYKKRESSIKTVKGDCYYEWKDFASHSLKNPKENPDWYIQPDNPPASPKPSIIDVANWFLSKRAMSHKAVSALCYLAQCHHIGYSDNNESLFEDDFEAHVGRPTNTILLKLAEENNYSFPAYTGALFNFTEDQLETLEMVWNGFGNLEEYELDFSSHDECFKLVRNLYRSFEPCTDIIPKELIADVYSYKIACMDLPEYEKYTERIQEYTKER